MQRRPWEEGSIQHEGPFSVLLMPLLAVPQQQVAKQVTGAGQNSVRVLGAHYIPRCILIFNAPRTATDLDCYTYFFYEGPSGILAAVCLLVLCIAPCKL